MSKRHGWDDEDILAQVKSLDFPDLTGGGLSNTVGTTEVRTQTIEGILLP